MQPEELLRQGERRRHVVPPKGPQGLRRRPHPEGHPGREDRRGPSSLFLILSLPGIVLIYLSTIKYFTKKIALTKVV